MLLEIQMTSYSEEIKEVFFLLVVGVGGGFVFALLTEAFLGGNTWWKWWKKFLLLAISFPIFAVLTIVSFRATSDIFLWVTFGLMYLVSLVLVFLERK